MGALFISHSSVDRSAAQDLSDRLEAEGFAAIFLDFDPDHGIPAGRSWERELYAQLRRTDALIFLATPASTASRWCFAEVTLARSLGKPIFPVRLGDGARMPLLEDVQWVDMTTEDGAFPRLLGGLRRAGLDPSDSFAWDATRPPFPGLEPFAIEDAPVFFGRDREVEHLLELMQPTLYRDAGRVVAIVGPSGSGKSSLLFAGLLPRLARQEDRWLVLPRFTPGTHPVESLAGILSASSADRDRSDLHARLLRDGAGALVELAGELARRGGSGRRVLLVLDQAEELITRSGVSEQQAFLALLNGALRPESPLWAVLTLRSEFLSPRPERAGLAELVNDLALVEPLSRSRLAEVIEGPARLGGLEFEPGLSERIADETTGGDALPLLAFTLRELYDRAGADGLITVAEYEAAGGVVGALQRSADRLLDALTRRDLGPLVIPTLLKLASVEGAAEPTRRTLAHDSLSAEEQAVVDTFTEARLLVVDRQEGQETTVSVAHEALLRQWPPLREAIEAERSALQMRSDLERLAADWEQAGKEQSYLLRGSRLREAEVWAATHGNELNLLERDFLDESRRAAAGELEMARRANRRLRLLAVGLGLALVGAVVAGVLAVRSSQEAESQSRLALSRVVATEAERLLERRPDVAILAGLQSLSLARDEEPEPRVPAALVTGLARQTHASRLLSGHDDQVQELAYAPGGRTIVSASWDGSVRFWDARTGQQRGDPLQAGQGRLTGLAFSPRGRLVATGGADGTVRLWDARSRRSAREPLTGHEGMVHAIAFSSDGELLASAGDDGAIRVRHVESGRLRPPVLNSGGDRVRDLEFSPDGELIASGGEDATARLWRVSTGEPIAPPIRGHRDTVQGVAFNPTGDLLATASRDNSIRLWRVSDGSLLGTELTGHRGGAWDAAFSPDGRLLATVGGDGDVRVWEARTGRPLDQPLIGHTSTVKDVEFSRDGKRIASASWDGSVRLWDVAETVSVSGALTGHESPVLAVRASPDGTRLASADEDGTLRLWSLPSGRPEGAPLQAHDAELNALAFSPDGRLLASSSADATVRLWKLPGLGAHQPPLEGHEADVFGVAFSPDGNRLASGSLDETARLWDVSSGEPRGAPLRHPDIVNGVAFSPDGKLVATGSSDQAVHLWKVASREHDGPRLLGHSNEVLTVDFSPDGRRLVTASGDTTGRIWQVSPRRPAGMVLRGHTDWVWDAAFSHDGRTVATASSDATVRRWDASDGSPVDQPLSGHEGAVYSVDYVGDSGMLVTAGTDRTVRLWMPSFDDWVDVGCRLVNRNLSMAEWNQIASGLDYERTCPELSSGEGAPDDAPAARYQD
jgi:WD40 repeat protein